MASPYNKNSSSQAEIKKAWYHGFHKFEHGIYAGIKSFYIAKVVSYDRKKHRADVLPLANWSDGTKSAQYLDIPVVESCYMFDEMIDALQLSKLGKLPTQHLMRAGVPVVCAVLDRDNDNWNGSTDTYTPNSGRMHDANDSVVIGVLGGSWLSG